MSAPPKIAYLEIQLKLMEAMLVRDLLALDSCAKLEILVF